ncbi:Replication protein O [Ralstonia pseudosolanacearum]|uniref:Replication protein O n=1 Tax=Ralstonia pseudosolanacearum TaxID=1310165 RepID=UPI0011CECE9B|nr:Replication protein O [Ralstonia pseudosolanacearum]
MSIAQHSVAGEGSAHAQTVGLSPNGTDQQAEHAFHCDSTNLPWLSFRAAFRASHIEGLPGRARALLCALARTVDAKQPEAPIFARRELLTGRAMQSMRTFYRSLDDLEAAGLIRRPPQKRYGQAGLFGRAYLHLTPVACQLLGLTKTERLLTHEDHASKPDMHSASQNRGQRSATVADGAIYKDLSPTTQKRQPGALPADLERLSGLGFRKFLIFKLMAEARDNNKRLSDVVDVTWASLSKASKPINYLRALLRKPVDFSYQAKQVRTNEAGTKRHLAIKAEIKATLTKYAGRTFYDTVLKRELTVSPDGSMLTAISRIDGRIQTAVSGWFEGFLRALQEGRVQPGLAPLNALALSTPTPSNRDSSAATRLNSTVAKSVAEHRQCISTTVASWKARRFF